jgi:hypothetical protein
MSRTSLSLSVDDVSAFAKALGRQLAALERAPGHVELLNMVSRATGYRNFQHFRAQSEAASRLDVPKPAPAPVDYRKVKRLMRYFDAEGCFVRWPKKHSHQGLCLWVLWSRIPPRRVFSEREISELLQKEHLFGDYALLRRELFDRGLITRTPDGREYRRLERKPSPEAVELIGRLGA